MKFRLILSTLLSLTPSAFAAQSVNSQGEAAALLAQQLYCNTFNFLSGDVGIIIGLLVGFAGFLIMILRQLHFTGFIMILGGVCLTALPAFFETTLFGITQMSSSSGMGNQVFDIDDQGFSASNHTVDCSMFDVQLQFIQQSEIAGTPGGTGPGGTFDPTGTGFGAGSGQCEERNGTVGSSVVAGGATLTSCYGPRPAPCTGCSTTHGGVDIAGPAGTPILAYAGGTVTRAGYSSSYGWVVYIDHGNGVETRYGHMQPGLNVSVGQTITAGTQLGGMGSTGNSTGSHLHFEVREGGSTVDPCSVTNVCS